ncbi:hypothetical protein [Acinetobacter baylyi]|uniref:hypothetical protein n=1 Tax=Acinetobacter baylyi TaxID=202950 RepID=UPI000EA316F4|nr:hypothetical protein [Acinetobacter baylyi]
MARSQIEIARVRLWYSFLEFKLNKNSEYGVEKAIEPHVFRKNKNGDIIRNKKWRNYSHGLHTPILRTLESVKPYLPESIKILNHPIWSVIEKKEKEDILDLSSLSWDTQKILFKSNRSLGTIESKLNLGNRDLLMLENKASLDSLAAQIIFLKDAYNKNKMEEALRIGRSIYKTLLILCTETPYAKVCDDLILLMELYVFPLTYNGHKRISIKNIKNFSESVIKLRDLFLALEDEGIIDVGRASHINVMSKLLNGKYGLDILQEFLPPLIDQVEK